MNKTVSLIMTVAITIACVFAPSSGSFACDIAVISAKAASTDRPFIWKSRDNGLGWEQEVAAYKRKDNNINPTAGGSIRVIDRTRGMAAQSGGVNEAGFAITNTTVYQESPLHEYLASANLNIMSNALKRCATVADFDEYIATWHEDIANGTRILSGNFVTMDAYGGATYYELTTGDSQTDIYAYGGRVKVHRIDANTGFVTNEDGALIGNNGDIGTLTDEVNNVIETIMNREREIITEEYSLTADRDAIVDSNGFLIDDGAQFCGVVNGTNSSFWISLHDDTPRQDRALEMMLQLKSEERLNYRSLLQEVAKDIDIEAYQLDTYPSLSNRDAGTDTQQSTFHTISRYSTNLAFVVDGVPPGSDPRLSTMWINLGEPSVGAAVPFFPAANAVSNLAWGDTKFLGIVFDFSPTCYLNRAITNVRDTLYDNNGSDGSLLSMLPHLDITGQLFLDLLQVNWLFNTPENAWDDFEGALSEWHKAWLANMAVNDSTDKTIDLPLFYQVQEWVYPLEHTLFDQTATYLDQMRLDQSKISESNLSTFSDYAVEFLCENFEHTSDTHKTWSFDDPWAVEPEATNPFINFFKWLGWWRKG